MNQSQNSLFIGVPGPEGDPWARQGSDARCALPHQRHLAKSRGPTAGSLGRGQHCPFPTTLHIPPWATEGQVLVEEEERRAGQQSHWR